MTQPKAPSRAELELLLKKARELVKQEPQKAAMILTDWLNKPRKLSPIRGQAIRKKAG